MLINSKLRRVTFNENVTLFLMKKFNIVLEKIYMSIYNKDGLIEYP